MIVHHLALEASELWGGSIELDESYFGGIRKGKRGRAAAGKAVVLGILKRGGKAYTQVLPDVKASTLVPIITDKVAPDSIVYTDSFRSYNALDVNKFHHHRVNHSKLFGKNPINGVENFWNQAKRVLRKYNGMAPQNFNAFLKECEFRFNYGSSAEPLKILRKCTQI